LAKEELAAKDGKLPLSGHGVTCDAPVFYSASSEFNQLLAASVITALFFSETKVLQLQVRLGCL